METLVLVIVGILFLLAISDLIVGVSNDAVNFLNSAIGSKSAPFWVIMIIASLGVIVGATFSTGMMEVARKGIFHPEYFYLSEILFIFIAVMLTDVILLDAFNTFGMPTSTTVSIVFELLGAAVAISLVKIANDPNAGDLSQYINSAKALAIITGILLSVVISFTVGSVIMYVVRYFFTFNINKSIKYLGSIWGGLAISTITYFIFIKGMKGSAFASYELASGESLKDFFANNTWSILLYSFLGWTVLLQLLKMVFNFNILKMIVLVGTFALAMAFAGNDLVNFIGVPMAGYSAYQDFASSGGTDATSYLMTAMGGKVATPIIFLLLSGLIMVITLWLSKKSRTVTKTELGLSNQDEQDERFGSSYIARSIVRGAVKFSNGASALIPQSMRNHFQRRFDTKYFTGKTMDGSEAVSFDLLRASVNLTVGSALIALGTSLKLPLSTTYVTFMVAMGTSLADRAWGRESAVYRITGVITVIGGWFMTALVAFTASFLVALFIYWAQVVALVVMLAVVLFILYRTHILHKKREASQEEDAILSSSVVKGEEIMNSCTNNVLDNLSQFVNVFENVIAGLKDENRKQLYEVDTKVIQLNKDAKKLKSKIFQTLKRLEESDIESGPYYVQILDYLREMAHSLSFIAHPAFQHVDNNHKSLNETQIENLEKVNQKLTVLFGNIIHFIDSNSYENLHEVIDQQEDLIKTIKKFRKDQIKSLKQNTTTSTKASTLYFNILYETQNFLLHSINLLKAQRDFSSEMKK